VVWSCFDLHWDSK